MHAVPPVVTSDESMIGKPKPTRVRHQIFWNAMSLQITARQAWHSEGLTSVLALSNRSAVKFPDVAGSVIQLLMDFLGDTNTASALDVIFFVREIVETNEKLRAAILARLLDSFTQIRSSRVRPFARTAVACSAIAAYEGSPPQRLHNRAFTTPTFLSHVGDHVEEL